MHGGKILGKIRKHFNYLQVKGEIFLSSWVEDREGSGDQGGVY